MQKLGMLKRACGLFAFGLTASLYAGAPTIAADNYPSGPITMIVPTPPGGGTDTYGRPLAEHLSQVLGVPVIVENSGGAGGAIGVEKATLAEPDGYTILFADISQSHALPLVEKSIQYDPDVALRPVARVVTIGLLFAARPDFELDTIEELVEAAKADPGKYTFAHPGIGTIHHLNWVMFMDRADIDLVPVAYNGGAAGRLALQNGEVDLNTFSTNYTQDLLNGVYKPLAMTTPERYPGLPNVPTMIESGYPGYVFDAPFGLFVPAGVPDEIVTKLNEAVQSAPGFAPYQQLLDNTGAYFTLEGPEEFSASLQEYVTELERIIEETGIAAD